jgi:glycosyltransferase involved in cell wall biosynthesis
MLGEVFNRAEEFDVIHFHVDYLHFPLSRQIRVPNVTTLHGRLDLPEHAHIYSQFSDIPVISISNSQRQPVAFANWIATVYHGLPSDLYKLDPAPGRYLAFIGRFSPEKRADRAIEIAKQLGMPLRIAAKIDKADKEYFEQTMKPMLDHPLVEYVGEIGESEKQEFLGGAQALLFPIDWPEPFGLVLIEAMACGTPVIAFRRGSVPEIIEDGLTGFIVDSMDEAVAAVRKVDNLSRAACRCEFEKRFTASRMAGDYLDEYVQLQTRESPVLTRMCT